MSPASNPHLSPLIRKLESIVDLSAEERQAVTSTPVIVRKLRADQDIVRDQDRPSQCCLVLEGLVFRYKLLEGGKRQIFSFHIPGDIPDLQSLHLKVMDHNVGTLVDSEVAFITHENVRKLIRTCPRIGDAFWRDTLIDAAVFREWMAGIGRRDARGRIAHLFCELFSRFRAVDLTDGNAFRMPITQAEIGDSLGLSTVHVNRTLQELRGEGLITTRNGMLVVEDWERLKEAGQFDATYLHLNQDAA